MKLTIDMGDCGYARDCRNVQELLDELGKVIHEDATTVNVVIEQPEKVGGAQGLGV